ncbi:putative Xaa-Pro aminopeptidase P [Teratosphaeria destructans]|uniref:Xaa-Pro aminopeptidase P n=1 Tax=Teratosphaeria destructans TaxID=418781 RepID=A0A9W7SLU4_9PEZI|nr:putative Xaa-Pro aminopeptidase P [Teratosphaeria destructans]
MAPSDSKETFMRIPWAANLLNRPNIVLHVPNSRKPKASREDSLYAETFKTPRTLRSCISFYQRPSPSDEKIEEVSTLYTVGDGLNGHPDIMHGGIVATVIDESMGILGNANQERRHLLRVQKGEAQGELPPPQTGTFTAFLHVNYLAPVQTPGAIVVTARYTKRQGDRKEWIEAVIKQHIPTGDDDYGEEIVCAKAEALFVKPKRILTKL